MKSLGSYQLKVGDRVRIREGVHTFGSRRQVDVSGWTGMIETITTKTTTSTEFIIKMDEDKVRDVCLALDGKPTIYSLLLAIFY